MFKRGPSYCRVILIHRWRVWLFSDVATSAYIGTWSLHDFDSTRLRVWMLYSRLSFQLWLRICSEREVPSRLRGRGRRQLDEILFVNLNNSWWIIPAKFASGIDWFGGFIIRNRPCTCSIWWPRTVHWTIMLWQGPDWDFVRQVFLYCCEVRSLNWA